MKDSAFTAATYDLFMQTLDPLLIKNWRRRLWNKVKPPCILEAGAGTGLNIPFYQSDYEITALDKNEYFLERARHKARNSGAKARFVLGDVQDLPFPDNTFDSAVTTFLFCQLADPLRGLKELRRVLKPGGQLLLLEHVRPKGKLESLISSLSEPIYRLTGEQIAHDTDIFVRKAGFTNITTDPLLLSIIKIIEAKKSVLEVRRWKR
ncbi:MAG: methyltransferase domain-containing protein [Bacillota bacterium]|nr:methyltransferase domain-containing protein [Bacillota bacterium]